jgi:hypothetical protein
VLIEHPENERSSPTSRETFMKATVVWCSLLLLAVLGMGATASASPLNDLLTDARPTFGYGVEAGRRPPERVEIDRDGDGTVDIVVHYRVDGRIVTRTVTEVGHVWRTFFTVDEDWRVLEVTDRESSVDSAGFAGWYATTYRYDADGRLVSACSFTDPGMLTFVPDNVCVDYSYDASGRLEVAEDRRLSAVGEPTSDVMRRLRFSYRNVLGERVQLVEVADDLTATLFAVHVAVVSEDGRLLSATYDVLATPLLDRSVVFVEVDGEETTVWISRGGESVTLTSRDGRPVEARGDLTVRGWGRGDAHVRWIEPAPSHP